MQVFDLYGIPPEYKRRVHEKKIRPLAITSVGNELSFVKVGTLNNTLKLKGLIAKLLN